MISISTVQKFPALMFDTSNLNHLTKFIVLNWIAQIQGLGKSEFIVKYSIILRKYLAGRRKEEGRKDSIRMDPRMIYKF